MSASGRTGGCLTGPNPTDRGKNGSKYHLFTDGNGIPLAVALSAANTDDSKLFEPLLDAAPAIKGSGRGRPRRRPEKLHADKGYDNRRRVQSTAARCVSRLFAVEGVGRGASLRG